MSNGLLSKRVITDGNKFKKVIDLKAESVQLPTGMLTNEDLNRLEPGTSFIFNQKKYYVFECTLADFIDKKLERKTQIMYPKEMSYLIYKLDITPGNRVGDAGTGSGAMALSLSKAVGSEGMVYTYEEREDFVKLIQKNFSRGKIFDNIKFYNQDISSGIEQNDLDAFTLDVKQPWEVLHAVTSSLKTGGNLGILVPTYNQISYTIPYLKAEGFFLVEIVELMLRRMKHNPERIRPEDTMIGHTGFMILAKKLVESLEEQV